MVSNEKRRNDKVGAHLLVGFSGTTLDDELKTFIREFHVGGVVLFKRNVEHPDQLKALLEAMQSFALESIGRGLLVAIDQEGGPVQRLTPPFTQLPSARAMAEEGTSAIEHWSAVAAREMREVGIHINLAPVLDVLSEASASHFMEERCLGTDPVQVSELGKSWIRTLQDGSISATAKHYPGLGRADVDPHHFAPVVRWESDEAMEKDLRPFKEAIQAGVHCVMTSHALYPFLDPRWPATLSPQVNHEWLRRRLGFEGVLLSDDMDMAAVLERYTPDDMVHQGLLSSIDLFLLCQRAEHVEPFYRALERAMAGSGELAECHRQSLTRLDRLFRFHALL